MMREIKANFCVAITINATWKTDKQENEGREVLKQPLFLSRQEDMGIIAQVKKIALARSIFSSFTETRSQIECMGTDVEIW